MRSSPIRRPPATPHVLLVGPFRNEPDLVAVALYVGIGFIEVRDLDKSRYSYGTSAIDGADMENRAAFLLAALHLYFDDVTFEVSGKA